MTVEWSRLAAEDIRSLHRFIEARSPKSALRIVQTIIATVEQSLSRNALLGRPGRVPDTRELVIPKTPYVIPYRVRHDRVQILRVYHHRLPWPDQF